MHKDFGNCNTLGDDTAAAKAMLPFKTGEQL